MRKVSIMPVISMDCVETFAAVAAISCMDIVFIKPHGAKCRAAFFLSVVSGKNASSGHRHEDARNPGRGAFHGQAFLRVLIMSMATGENNQYTRGYIQDIRVDLERSAGIGDEHHQHGAQQRARYRSAPACKRSAADYRPPQ